VRCGRPLAFDAACYRARNVERCVGWPKRWRAITPRDEKRALNYRVVVVIAALLRRMLL